ncbi:hypothetical protein [Desulfospira joergensenii]|uniref:hypothetical protein n=1 Tax=Desulfospira joergensenii TaxID=53329 RepID=UPI0003B2E9D9|nr:hypothetical protein [Desulfospira joergensenii]
MAFIYKQESGSGRSPGKQIGLALIVALTLWVMLKTGSDTLSADNTLTLISVIGAVLFFVLVAFKKNPLTWLALFRKDLPRQVLMPQLLKDLSQLDEDFDIFPGITLEFFKISCLVVSPQGIFVISTPDRPLDKGSRQMDIETKKLWQRCHMIRMLIKKGYDKEIMPIPLLAIPGVEGFEYKGVGVIPPDQLSDCISKSDSGLDKKLMKSLSLFLAQRYLR